MNRICKSPLRDALLLLTASIFLCGLPERVNADFIFSQFGGISTLNLVQDAAIAGNVLRLTPAATDKRGAAWYATQQTVNNGFETSFQFQINNVSTVLFGADGFAFVIQNEGPTAIGTINAGGSGLGYHELPNSVAVEFDTFGGGPSDPIGDPNGNHLSVHTRGTLANSAVETYSLGNTGTSLTTDLSDGLTHNALIRYVPGTLSVFLDGSATATLSVPLNLATSLNLNGGQAYVGFTSATGGAYENHDILSWSFTSVPEPAGAMLLAIGLWLVTALGRPERVAHHLPTTGR